MDEKYIKLIQILKAADDAGLFDLSTSNMAGINSCHRQAIRSEIFKFDEELSHPQNES